MIRCASFLRFRLLSFESCAGDICAMSARCEAKKIGATVQLQSASARERISNCITHLMCVCVCASVFISISCFFYAQNVCARADWPRRYRRAMSMEAISAAVVALWLFKCTQLNVNEEALRKDGLFLFLFVCAWIDMSFSSARQTCQK